MKLRRYIALLLSVLLTLSGAALCPVSAEPGNGDTFKVLFIGNSASEDLTDGGFANDSMLYDAVKSMVGDECEVTVGLCAKGGKSMAWHATAAMRNTPDAYSFRIVGGGDPTWRVASYGCTSAYALGYADWDAVVIQPWGQETLTGKSTGGNEEASTLRELSASVPYMLDHIAANAPGAICSSTPSKTG